MEKMDKSYINSLGLELLHIIIDLVNWYSKAEGADSTRDASSLKLALQAVNDVYSLTNDDCSVDEETIRRIRLIPPRNKKSKKTT